MDQHYIYAPLPSTRSIRLLQVNETCPEDVCKLKCTLDVFNFDSTSPPYDALSYTWGPPLSTTECEEAYSSIHDVTIFVETKDSGKGTMTIGRNLFEALTHIERSRTRATVEPPQDHVLKLAPYIWIDSICINQSDDTEKEHQVAFMGEVYAKAKTVIGWMGIDDGTYAGVAQFFFASTDKFRSWIEVLHTTGHPTHAYGVPSSEGWTIMGPDVPISREQLAALGKFYTQRRYLRRLWVCQELALGKSPVILLEAWAIPLEKFLINSQFFKLHSNLLHILRLELGTDAGPGIDFGTFDRIFNLRRWFEYPDYVPQDIQSWLGSITNEVGKYCRLLHIFLYHTHPTLCYDARDRVYALLGMLNSTLPKGFDPPLTPNYALDARRIYFLATSLLLRHLPHLEVLGHVSHPQNNSMINRPSWVPNFGSDSSVKSTSLTAISAMQPGIVKPEVVYNASGKHLHESGIDTFTKQELRLRGRRLETVSDISPRMKTLLEGAISLSELCWLTLHCCHFILRAYSKFGAFYWNGQQLNEVLLGSLTHEIRDEAQTQAALRSFKAFVTGNLACLREAPHYGEYGAGLDAKFSIELSQVSDLLQSISDLEGAPTEAEVAAWQPAFSYSQQQEELTQQYFLEITGFQSQFEVKLMNRCMFMTERSFGLGPGAMQPGDEVWILIPGRVPYILRPTQEENQYLFIGEAYLHGIMFGEAVNGLKESDFSEVVLV